MFGPWFGEFGSVGLGSGIGSEFGGEFSALEELPWILRRLLVVVVVRGRF